jgi:chromosome segregation ATPase
MRRVSRWLVVPTAIASFTSLPVCAQTSRESGGANAQLMQQIQQLGSERTALQAENARMKKELAELTKERDALRAGKAALDRRAAASEAATALSTRSRESAEAEIEKQKERMQELVARFRETAQTLRGVETERATFQQSLVVRDAEVKACRERNEALYKLNGEVLARLENDGVWSRMARVEPFTRLKRVELENLVDDYRYRAEGLQEKPAAAAFGSQPSQLAPR